MINSKLTKVVIVVVICLLAIMLYQENNQNKKFERYFSQILSNDQNDLIESILYSREEVDNILSANFSLESKHDLINSMNNVSMMSQDLVYFSDQLDLIDPRKINNSTSAVAMYLEVYFSRLDPTKLTKEDKGNLKGILTLLNQWVAVINEEYDGITYENKNEVIGNVLNDKRKDFFDSDVWRNIIVGLERVSKDNMTFAKSINS